MERGARELTGENLKTVWAYSLTRGKYHCTVDLLFDWFGLVCFANKNKNCQLSYSWFQTSQTGGQWCSDTSPFSIPCFNYKLGYCIYSSKWTHSHIYSRKLSPGFVLSAKVCPCLESIISLESSHLLSTLLGPYMDLVFREIQLVESRTLILTLNICQLKVKLKLWSWLRLCFYKELNRLARLLRFR